MLHRRKQTLVTLLERILLLIVRRLSAGVSGFVETACLCKSLVNGSEEFSTEVAVAAIGSTAVVGYHNPADETALEPTISQVVLIPVVHTSQ